VIILSVVVVGWLCGCISPDHGVTRARKLAQFLKTPIAIIDKRRSIDKMNTSEVMNIIGDVEGKPVLIDDMIDTAGTICHAQMR
jgi:ribose-phosphate pyrophosphokinase